MRWKTHPQIINRFKHTRLNDVVGEAFCAVAIVTPTLVFIYVLLTRGAQ